MEPWTNMNKNTLKSVAAVVMGALVGILLSTASDAVMRAMGYFPVGRQPMGDGPFAAATLYRTLYGVVGAYLTARLAPDRPLMHALILGSLGFVASIVGAAAMWGRLPALGPKWYAIALVVLAIPTAWVGGTLRLMQLRHQM